MRVLVAEKIGASGVALLREHFDVDEGDHLDRIGEYDGILIRSATKLTADVIEQATSLKAIGRAGVGVDNVDVAAATKRGIVVANAPQSNVVTAAEHTMALLLALARNVPQAHASLTAALGALEVLRRRADGQDARHPGLRAHRPARRPARAGLRHARRRLRPVRGAERYRELGVEQAEPPTSLRRSRLPHAAPAQDARDRGLARRRGAGQVQGRRARAQRRPRPARSSTRTSQAALDSARSRRRARRLPLRADHRAPALRLPQRHRHPHLGASTAEATDRAGFQAAEQVVAALTGGVVSSAVNVPAVAAEDMEVLGPFLPLCRQLGRLGDALAEGSSVDASRSSCSGASPSATRAARRRGAPGVLTGTPRRRSTRSTRPRSPRSAGSRSRRAAHAGARLHRPRARHVVSGERRERVAGTTLGRQHRPHLLEAWASASTSSSRTTSLFRYRDVPGMIGRVGTAFGGHGIKHLQRGRRARPEDRRRVARGDGRYGRSGRTGNRRGGASWRPRTSSRDAP
jgi:D-3-phosphoglycerate dehydrogenase